MRQLLRRIVTVPAFAMSVVIALVACDTSTPTDPGPTATTFATIPNQETSSPAAATIITPATWLPQERIVARIPMPGPVRSVAAGKEGVWVLVHVGRDSSTVLQIDAGTNKIKGEPLQLPFE